MPTSAVNPSTGIPITRMTVVATQQTSQGPTTLSMHHPGLMLPVKAIRLGKGRHAIVDPEDYHTVAGYNWRARENKGRLRVLAWVAGLQRNLLMHALVTGYPLVTHVNGDGLDCRRINLIQFDIAKIKAGSSRFKGVMRESSGNGWRAQIVHQAKIINLGRYSDEVEAARAYDRQVRELRGEQAATNLSLGLYEDGHQPGAELPRTRRGSRQHKTLATLAAHPDGLTLRQLAGQHGESTREPITTIYSAVLYTLQSAGHVDPAEKMPSGPGRAPGRRYKITDAGREHLAAVEAPQPKPPERQRAEYPWAADAALRNHAGESVTALARDYKADPETIRRALERRGVPVLQHAESPRRHPQPAWAAEAARRYLGGEPLSALHAAYKVSHEAMKRILTAEGVTLRSLREAARLRDSRTRQHKPQADRHLPAGTPPGDRVAVASGEGRSAQAGAAAAPAGDPRKWMQVAAALRRHIQLGAIAEGERVPTAELMHEHGVSRPTVAKAFCLLAREGYLQRFPGAGYLCIEKWRQANPEE